MTASFQDGSSTRYCGLLVFILTLTAFAALAARAIATRRGLPVEVVIGEEVTTRGGHLLALFIEEPIRPFRSLRSTVAAIHEAGGLAVPAHPLVPYPLCAQGFALRRLLADPDPRFHPDGLETFNPTALGRPFHGRVVAFATEFGLAAIGSSDARSRSTITSDGRLSRTSASTASARRTNAIGHAARSATDRIFELNSRSSTTATIMVPII